MRCDLRQHIGDQLAALIDLRDDAIRLKAVVKPRGRAAQTVGRTPCTLASAST